MLSRSVLQNGAAAVGIVIAAGYLIHWVASPSQQELVTEGRELFLHEWEPDDALSPEGDGLGPVFNARSCVACHFQGGVGGGGDSDSNVVAFQVLPSRDNDVFQAGVVHAESVWDLKESKENVNRIFPPIPNAVTVRSPGCRVTSESLDPVLFHTMNTPALFGTGLIDEISDLDIRASHASRALDAVSGDFDPDFDPPRRGKLNTHGLGSVGKFGWRGQFASLEGFVATACAVELGLTNPVRAQDIPMRHTENDRAELDMTSQQLTALVEFCRSLPRPVQILPADPAMRADVNEGEKLFHSIGCAVCHQPDMGSVTGVYSDFLLYSLERDEGGYLRSKITLEVPLPDDEPHPEEWQTPPLWGVADSAPYLHDGSESTLEGAILRHEGSAKKVLDQYTDLPTRDRNKLIAFLESLKAPRNAKPVPAAGQSQNDFSETP